MTTVGRTSGVGPTAGHAGNGALDLRVQKFKTALQAFFHPPTWSLQGTLKKNLLNAFRAIPTDNPTIIQQVREVLTAPEFSDVQKKAEALTELRQADAAKLDLCLNPQPNSAPAAPDDNREIISPPPIVVSARVSAIITDAHEKFEAVTAVLRTGLAALEQDIERLTDSQATTQATIVQLEEAIAGLQSSIQTTNQALHAALSQLQSTFDAADGQLRAAQTSAAEEMRTHTFMIEEAELTETDPTLRELERESMISARRQAWLIDTIQPRLRELAGQRSTLAAKLDKDSKLEYDEKGAVISGLEGTKASKKDALDTQRDALAGIKAELAAAQDDLAALRRAISNLPPAFTEKIGELA